jgi:rhamnosyltransferase
MQKAYTVGVAFITHQAKRHLPSCLPPLLRSPLKPRVLVVNSSSQDGTVELAQELGAETLVIPRHQFNHGTTREYARRYLGTEVVVMMTPDAYAIHEGMLEALITPLQAGQASIAYARQIPHDGADFFEAFPREFNYPPHSQIRRIEDLSHYGPYTFFCSDTCAAYLNAALDEIGGFQPALFGEDTVAVAKMMRKGHRIAYVAEAVVKHSHRYSLIQEFRRHFDIGLSRREYADLIQAAGSDSSRGKAFVKALFCRLLKEKPYGLPYAFVQTACKWVGYQIGRASLKAPRWFKKALSSQDFYWMSEEGMKKEQK